MTVSRKPPCASASANVIDVKTLSGGRIMTKLLIADDDAVTRNILRMVLDKNSLPFIEAVDGDSAWKHIRGDASLRLAILDWAMPGMDGIEVCRKIKSRPGAPFVYIIMLTSKDTTEEVVHALDAGADDFISKPPDISILRARINAGLRTVDMHDKLHGYAVNMEKLAAERAEQLLQADRLTTLGLLSAGIAHEVNNAASYISINIQTINRHWTRIGKHIDNGSSAASSDEVGEIVKEMPSMLEEMHQGIFRIKEIVDGLKAYSRSEPLKETEVDIHRCMTNSLKICGGRLKKTITVKTTFAERLPGFIGDGHRLEQVFVNLLLNAADSLTKNIAGVIEIRTLTDASGIIVVIGDNGPGIEPSSMERLFTPFFTTKEIGKGTGLGLYICKTIVEEHNGTIEAHNRPGGGAEITVRLPVKRGEHRGISHDEV